MKDKDKAKDQLLTELRSQRKELDELRQELEELRSSGRSTAEKSSGERDAALRESKEVLARSHAETSSGLEQLGISREAGRKSASDLVESEKRYKILGDLFPFGVWTSDAEGNFTYLSDSYLEMIGVAPDDPSLRNRVALMSPEDMKNAVSDWQSSLDTTKVWEKEHTVTGSDGKEYTILTRGVPIADKEGKPLSWFGVNIDISRRKDLEERLRQQERGYRTLVERLPKVNAARFDEHGRFQYASTGVARTYGIAAEELIGRRPSETAMDREFARTLEDAVERVLVSGQEAAFQHTFNLPSGQTHRAYTLILEREENSPVRNVIQTSYDITDLNALDERLRKALEEAERANRVKSEFLANMSHEIRTPMNGVIGMTELALQEIISGRAREYLQMVKQSGQNLLVIINDILDLAKIEAGKAELNKHTFDLREAVESTLEHLRANAENKGLQFLHAFDPEISGLVEGDRGRLSQVLTNIVGNAVKFTEQGRVAVSVNLAEVLSADSVHILFMVKDDGIGIPRDKLLSIFKPFTQASGSAHAKYGGTGLGLSISKDLIELMGGRIWAESEPGQGSTFYFTVVLGLPKEKPEPAQGAQPQAHPQARSLKILLAEDNLVNRILAVELLQKRGHLVEAVENGREALEKLKQETFDLVLMDVRMPEMGGEEATRRIRSGEAGDPDVPIVALTAHAIKGDRERILAMGMDDYLAKPIDVEEIDRVLERLKG